MSDPNEVAKVTAKRMKAEQAAERDAAAAGQQHDDAYERLVAPDPQEESVDAAAVRRHVSWWTRASWVTDDRQWMINVTPVTPKRDISTAFRGRKQDMEPFVVVEVFRNDEHMEFPHERHAHASIRLAKTKHTAQRAVAFFELVSALHSEEAFEVDEQQAQAELRKAGQRVRGSVSQTQDAVASALKDAQAATKGDMERQRSEIGNGAQDATWGPDSLGYDEMGQ